MWVRVSLDEIEQIRHEHAAPSIARRLRQAIGIGLLMWGGMMPAALLIYVVETVYIHHALPSWPDSLGGMLVASLSMGVLTFIIALAVLVLPAVVTPPRMVDDETLGTQFCPQCEQVRESVGPPECTCGRRYEPLVYWRWQQEPDRARPPWFLGEDIPWRPPDDAKRAW